MGLLSSELREAIAQNKTHVFVIEIDIGGTTYRYGPTHVVSESLGFYEAKVKSFDTLSRQIDLVPGGPQSIQFSVVLNDHDGTIATLMEGANSRSILTSDARLKLVAEGITADNFWTAFDGEITDYRMSAPYEWTFQFGTNDRALKAVNKLFTLSAYDFANIHEDIEGTFAPAVYGAHDDAGLTTGMIACSKIDTSGNTRYLVSAGWIFDVTKIYSNGSTASPGQAKPIYGTHWEYTTHNGRRYTELIMASDPGDNAVTVNCRGLTSNGNGYKNGGGGALIENPALQLKHFLVNFVFNGWVSGAWKADSTAPIDTEWFDKAAEYFDSKDIKAGRVIDGGQAGEATLTEWCIQHQTPCFWNNEGELAVAPDNYIIDDYIFSWPWFRDNEQILGPISYTYDTSILADEIIAHYMHGHADSKYFKVVKVVDAERDWDVVEELDMSWHRSTVATNEPFPAILRITGKIPTVSVS